MNVLHMMRTYGVGGGEKQLAQLFGTPGRHGAVEEFCFVYADKKCSVFFDQEAPDLDQHYLGEGFFEGQSPWQEFLYILVRLPIFQMRFFSLLKQQQIDVCVIHGFQAALVAWPAAVMLRHLGWAYMHRGGKSASAVDPFFRLLFWPYRRLLGNSEATTQALSRYAASHRTETILNGVVINDTSVESRIAREASEILTLVSVGRLIPGKAFDFLLDAMHVIQKINPDVELRVVGAGPERERLNRRVLTEGLDGCVCLVGWSDDVARHFDDAEIFVFASQMEGLSNAVIEAMYAGLPSVVVDAPGVTECHEQGVTGYVVPRSRPVFVQAVTDLLADANARQVMGEAARDRAVSMFSREANRHKFDDLYDRLSGE